MSGHPWLWDLFLWAIWLGWASLWFNRGFYPFDHGREALISYLWLNDIPPWSVNRYFPPIGLGGLFLFAALIKVFGFVPLYWRFAFVLIYGVLCWLIYRLLARLVPRGVAWTATVPVMAFFTNIHTVGYLYYFWNGVLLGMLSIYGFDRVLRRPALSRSWPWLMLSGGAAVAALMTMSLIGYATICAIAAMLGLRLLLADNRRRTLLTGVLWGCFALLFTGLVAGFLYHQGWLSGYLEQISSYPRHLHYYNPSGSLLSLLDWRFIFYYSGPTPAPWSLLSVVGFLGGVLVLARMEPAKLARIRIYLAILYWGLLVGVCAWLVIDSRSCLQFFHHWFRLVYLAPPFLVILCLVIVVVLLRGYIKDPATHPDTWHWLLLLAVGGAIFMAMTLSHHGRDHAVYSSVVFMPVVWAYVWGRFPGLFGFSWPSGLAAVLVAGAVLLGGAHRILDSDRQASWFEPAPYHTYSALRGLRGHNAPELDLVLSLARQIVLRGGKILVYPSHATIYPLVSTLPPLPFPDLGRPEAIYTYPRDPEIWRRALAKVDNPPPDLVILEKENSSREIWLQRLETPYVPQVAREIGNDFLHLGPCPHYRQIWQGKEYAVYLRKGQDLVVTGQSSREATK